MAAGPVVGAALYYAYRDDEPPRDMPQADAAAWGEHCGLRRSWAGGSTTIDRDAYDINHLRKAAYDAYRSAARP